MEVVQPAAGDNAAPLSMSHAAVAMRRVHGIVLLAAWCLLAPIAISLMALSKNNAKMRSRVFLPHAAIQGLVLLLSCAGLALGLKLPVADARTPHKCVGYLTLALAAFPVTAALWRPPKEEEAGAGGVAGAAERRRKLWERGHRACDLGAVAAAFVDGALGVRRTGMRPRCVPAAIMGAGLAVLTCTYGFKLFEAKVLLRESGAGGEKGGGEGGNRGGGGDVEKATPALSSKNRTSLKEEHDSVRAVSSASSEMIPEQKKKLGGEEPGFSGRRGGREEVKGNKEDEEKKNSKKKEKSDSFDSAAGCYGAPRDDDP